MKKVFLVLLVVISFTFCSINVRGLPQYYNDIVTIGHYNGVVNGENKYFELKNDLNSILFAIETLECFAHDYNENQTVNYYNNLILSYCRGININYTDDANNGSINEIFNVWNAVMGTTDNNFISFVKTHDNSNFTIREYLANFLLSTQYYNPSYGDLSPQNMDFGYDFIDPLNPEISYNKVDLIHFFTVIDGSYDFTENYVSFRNNFQKDLSGWAGDLQQYVTYDIFDNCIPIENLVLYNPNASIEDTIIDFNNLNNINLGHFSNNDMIADIDGINIAKIYLDNNFTLKNAIYSYYSSTNPDNVYGNNRYFRFINSVALESETSGDTIFKFKYEVYFAMALELNTYGSVSAINVNGIDPTYYILRKGESLYFVTPYREYREYCANLFIDYIIDMSTPPGSGAQPGDPNPGSGFYFEEQSLPYSIFE